MIKMYGFLEGPVPTGGWEVTMTCQCGVRLVQHISAKAEDARHDVGVTSHEQHELYRAHCSEQHQGEPFILEWVYDPSNYQGLHQSDIQVVSWSADDLASLGGLLQTTFSADREQTSTPPEDDL